MESSYIAQLARGRLFKLWLLGIDVDRWIIWVNAISTTKFRPRTHCRVVCGTLMHGVGYLS